MYAVQKYRSSSQGNTRENTPEYPGKYPGYGSVLAYIKILTFVFLPERAPKFLPVHTNFKVSPFLTALSGLRYMEQSSSEFPPETRRVLQVETWRLRGGGINRPNTTHALPRKAIQVERRCPRLWRPRLCRTWTLLIDFSRCGLKLFFVSHPAAYG